VSGFLEFFHCVDFAFAEGTALPALIYSTESALSEKGTQIVLAGQISHVVLDNLADSLLKQPSDRLTLLIPVLHLAEAAFALAVFRVARYKFDQI